MIFIYQLDLYDFKYEKKVLIIQDLIEVFSAF